MSEAKQDGGPFFPQTVDSWYGKDGNSPTPSGVTLRQWYAGLAMQAMVTAITKLHESGIIVNRPNDVAEIAHLYADTMIARGQK